MRAHSVYALLIIGCTSGGDDATVSVTANELGIVALETERIRDGAGDLFELRALGVDGVQRASVRLRIGTIAELKPLPEKSIGSELVLTVDGQRERAISYETQLFRITPGSTSAYAFVAIPEVRDVLAEANIVVDERQVREERAYATQCDSSHLNASPVARQCCFDPYSGENVFVLNNGDETTSLIARYRNPYDTPCTASDGYSPCSGSGCYYGPNGFSRPTLQIAEWSYKWYVADTGDCQPVLVNAWEYWPAVFSDVSGTFPTGQGCPGGGTGAFEWDY